MTTNQVPQPGAEPVKATARESALYQAGYEAGKAQALTGAAADLGLAAAHLQAAETTARNLHAGVGVVDGLVVVLPLKAKQLSEVRGKLEQARSLCESLRVSMAKAQGDASQAASAAAQGAQQAKQAFAERVHQAQLLVRKPGLLTRVLKAVRQ